jgi:hypothetical protein
LEKAHGDRLPFGEVHPSIRKVSGSKKYQHHLTANSDKSIISEERGEQMSCTFGKTDVHSIDLNAVGSKFESYMDTITSKFNCKSVAGTHDEVEQREDGHIFDSVEGDWDNSVKVDHRCDQRNDIDTSLNSQGEIEQPKHSSDKYVIVDDVPAKRWVSEDIPLHKSCGNVPLAHACEVISNDIREGLGKNLSLQTEYLYNIKDKVVKEVALLVTNVSHRVQHTLGSKTKQKSKVTKKVRFLDMSQAELENKNQTGEQYIEASTAMDYDDISQSRSTTPVPVKIPTEDLYLRLKNTPKKTAVEEFNRQPCRPPRGKLLEIETNDRIQVVSVTHTKDIRKRFVRVSPKGGRIGGRKRTLSTKTSPK